MGVRIIFLYAALLFCVGVRAQVSVVTQHNNLSRAGWNNREAILNPLNVNVRQFGKIFSVPIDDNMFAQVLILCNVNIAAGAHNIAVAATVNNTVYVFDADNGNLFWSKNFTPPGLRRVLNTDFGKCVGGENTDISRNVGIISTPVIDSVTNTLYFVARGTDAGTDGVGTYYTYLHAVDITNGNERTNSPVLISGSVPGTAADAVNGLVPFYPKLQNQRLALTLYNGTVFVGFSSHCDRLPYHGWIFGYDAATLSRKIIYCATPNGMGGGIWEAGGGMAIDNNGYMYIVTGNAEVDGIGKNGNPADMSDRAQSAIKLKITDTALIPVDFFTPSNYKALNDGADLDYGSMASFLVPNDNLYFTGAKDGNIYILNTDSMGSFHASGDQVAQSLELGSSVFMRCQPAFYQSSDHEFVYIWSEQSQLKAIPFDRDTHRFDFAKLKTGLVSITIPSSNISTSSNGLTDGTGIVWISRPGNKRSQIFSALDANDITKELWNSTQNLKRDSSGGFMKFAVPTIANGKVYLANSTGSVNVYGIIDTTAQLPDCSASTILSTDMPAFSSSSAAGGQASTAFDLDSTTQWASNPSSDEWIGVNLGIIDSICSVSIHWDSMLYATNFLIQVSDDSIMWKTVDSITGNNSTYNSYSLKTAGRYVRVYCSAGDSANGYSIKELTVFGRTIAGCEPPAGLTVNMIDTTAATIRWNAAGNATGYTLKFKPEPASVWQSFNTNADSLRVTGLSCNNYYQYAVQSKCDTDTSLTTETGAFNTLGCDNCILPTRTYQTDIGDVGVPGRGCYFTPANYNINGSGADIGNAADAFHFVYKDFNGDGNIRTQITAVDIVDSLNKAGVMFREDLSADARFVFIGITSSKKVVFINRQSKGNNAVSMVQAGNSVPCYVKIVKKGQVFSGYISTDNKNWDLVGSTVNQMVSNGIYVGLAVTSHNNSELSNAKFKSFIANSTAISCGALPTGVRKVQIGYTKLKGNACYYSYNRYEVNGSGATIGNKADSFFYVRQDLAGNKIITVKVNQQDSSNPFNKAGIMIRFANVANVENVFVGLTSKNGAFFQYRKKRNGITYTNYIQNIKAPYYLQLKKSRDSVYSGYISADGTNWQQIGEVVILPKSNAKFKTGMAVTSNDSTTLSSVVFDNWNVTDVTGLVTQNSFAVNNAGTAFIEQPLDLNIYPNPANKSFSIDFNMAKPGNAIVSIIEIGTGRVILRENILNFSGKYHKIFTNAIVPRGTYIVALKTSKLLQTRQLQME
ncbi:MAG TPA: discoidin domain-containing protein [Parafilimonas sp.]|nr:discoidin domain-containing protein [Parafilimonas sp.]